MVVFLSHVFGLRRVLKLPRKVPRRFEVSECPSECPATVKDFYRHIYFKATDTKRL